MSQQSERCVSHLKTVESYFRRPCAITFKGDVLSARNSSFMRDVYVLMACAWYSVLPEPELLSLRWSRALLAADVKEIVDAFKAADQFLLTRPTPASFKRWRRGSYPDFGQIFSPIQVMVDRALDRRDVRTCLLFITRANFPEPLGLENEAYAKWEAVALRDPMGHATDGEVAMIESWFPHKVRWSHDWDFVPRYGSGHSSDCRGTSLREKYRKFRSDCGLRYLATQVGFPLDRLPYHGTGLSRRSVLRFVPKHLDAMRTISMEPSSLMFFQQGGFREMHAVFKRRTRNHIELTNQDGNRDLAWEGSLTGEYATIDLSSASDSVSYRLVKELFSRTYLRNVLFLSRSREVVYENTVLRPSYYAPMGSALCFPVECAVFGAITASIMRDAGDRRAWRVYGDDIILPTDHAKTLIDRLDSLGFAVNTDKSYYSPCSGFRESCGGEYLEGEDVTPIRVSRRFRGLSPKSPTEIEGLIAMANNAWSMKWLRWRIVQVLLSLDYPPLFSADGEIGVWSPNPTNHRIRSRWNEDYQSMEYRAGVLKEDTPEPKSEDEDIRLFEWLRGHYGAVGPVADEPLSIVTPSRTRWGPDWCQPAPGWREGAPVPGESLKEN